MSRNRSDKDFSRDYGKTIPIYKSVLVSPRNHRYGGLRTGVYQINTACLNDQEFSIDGQWHRMIDYYFGAIEPESATKQIESKEKKMLND